MSIVLKKTPGAEVNTPSADRVTLYVDDVGNLATKDSTATSQSFISTGGDSDTLNLAYTPTLYTPDTTPTEVTTSTQLTSHLAGIENKLRTNKFADVTQYGATGDGVTDDQPAIQAMIDAGINHIWFPEGTYKLGAPLRTPLNRNYSYSFMDPVFLIGNKDSILTRDNLPIASNGIDFRHTSRTSSQTRYDNAALNIRGSHCIVMGLTIRDSYIGIYISDDPYRVDVDFDDDATIADWSSNSFNSFFNTQLENCGAGVYWEPSKGSFYNTLYGIHAYKCQVGFVSANMPQDPAHGGIAQCNRHTFTGCRSDRCVVGYYFRDFSTNWMFGAHIEHCGLTASVLTNGLDVIPGDGAGGATTFSAAVAATPFGTDGGGYVLDANSNKNVIFGTAEDCDRDLCNNGTQNKFPDVLFELSSDKVFFPTQPDVYRDRNVDINFGWITHSMGFGASALGQIPSANQKQGTTLNSSGLTLQDLSVCLDVSSGDAAGTNSRWRNAVYSLTEGGGASAASLLEGESADPLTIAQITGTATYQTVMCKVKITCNAIGGTRQYGTDLLIIAGATTNTISRYNIVEESQHFANGANSSVASTRIEYTLSVVNTNQLQLTVSNAANPNGENSGLENFIVYVETVGGVPIT